MLKSEWYLFDSCKVSNLIDLEILCCQYIMMSSFFLFSHTSIGNHNSIKSISCDAIFFSFSLFLICIIEKEQLANHVCSNSTPKVSNKL